VELLGTSFMELHPDGTLPEDPYTFTSEYCPEVSNDDVLRRFALLTRAECIAIATRFAADNERISRTYGVRIPQSNESDVAPEDDVRWQRVATERSALDRCLNAWLEEQSDSDDG
jgi:hypothetical protein